MRYLTLFIAGGLGTLCRYLLSLSVTERTDPHFPWGTLAVNLIGCTAIGLLLGFDRLDRFRWFDLRLLAVTGFLGGFTTFSAFSAEALLLFEARRHLLALTYIALSVVGGLALCALGYWSARVVVR